MRSRRQPGGAMLGGPVSWHTLGKGETMVRIYEPVAVLGIGAMGHGMVASALRACIA
jgi:hypothetical protein